MIIQGSPEWHARRCGKFTASRASDAFARTKNGWGASRAGYAGELTAERLTGAPYPSYSSSDMDWGREKEPMARAAYAFRFDCDVELIDFVDHPTVAMSGASPDGLVGDEGLIEIKCPKTSTHIETLRTKKVPEKYVLQMHWQMACTGRQWCDFISFDPRLPPSMQMFVKRLERDDKMIADMEKSAKEFLAEVDNMVATLRTEYELKETMEAA